MASITASLESSILVVHQRTAAGTESKCGISVSPNMTGSTLHQTIMGALRITVGKIIVVARAQVIEASEEPLSTYFGLKLPSVTEAVIFEDKDDCPCANCQEKRIDSTAAGFFKDMALEDHR